MNTRRFGVPILVLVLLLLATAVAFAATAVGVPTQNTSSSSRGTATVSHEVPAGSDRLLVVSVHTRAEESVTSITYGGTALRQAVRSESTNGDGVMRVEHWYLVNPPVGTANVFVDWATTVDPSAVVAVNFTGVNQTQPIGAVSADIGNSNGPSTSITTFFANSLIYGGGTSEGGDTDPFTPGTNVSELYDGATGTSTTADLGFWGGTKSAATAGAYTFNATASVSDDWGIAAMEIIDAATDVSSQQIVCNVADIILALDYTASLTEDDFDNILNAGEVFTNSLDDKTPPGGTPVDNNVSPFALGLVTFPQWNPTTNATTSNAGVVVGLQTTATAVINGIDRADADASGTGGPGGFGTHIGDAIVAARANFLSAGDVDKTDILVIITDGADYDGFTQEQANQFKNGGGVIYTVGFGVNLPDGDGEYLRSLASGDDFFYLAPSSSDLDEIVSTILEAILCSDFGDLPASYEGTNPALHNINIPDETPFCPALWLGDLTVEATDEGEPDPDASAQSSADAIGDDTDALGDDENGVVPLALGDWAPDTTQEITVEIVNNGGPNNNGAYLVGWFDFDRSGDFDASEIIEFGTLAGSATGTEYTLDVPIPADADFEQEAPLYARFRLYNGDPGTPDPRGEATCGEVEDYCWLTGPTAVALADLGAGKQPPVTVVALGAALLLLGAATLAGYGRRRG